MMYPTKTDKDGKVLGIKIESETCRKCDGKKFIWATDTSNSYGF